MYRIATAWVELSCKPRRASRWQDAMSLLRAVLQLPLQPSLILFNAAVSACAKGCLSHWPHAVQIYSSTNVYTYRELQRIVISQSHVWPLHTYTYIITVIHTQQIHTYIHTSMHTYIHTYIYVYVYWYINMCVWLYMCIHVNSLFGWVHMSNNWFCGHTGAASRKTLAGCDAAAWPSGWCQASRPPQGDRWPLTTQWFRDGHREPRVKKDQNIPKPSKTYLL